MKKILCFLVLWLWGLLGITQNITSTRAKELFGYRYISAQEAGLFEVIEIPFSEADLKYDFSSWLIPKRISDTITQYQLIQPTFCCQLPYEKSDTLNLVDAQKVLELVTRIRPSFPNEQGQNEAFKYFFRVKDSAPTKSGFKFKKAIAYSNNLSLTINLPLLVNAGVLDDNHLSYLLEEQGFIGLEPLPCQLPTINKQAVIILTLIYLNQ